MKKILAIPPLDSWYVEAHVEYLVRELADEFFIEIAHTPYPPYKEYFQSKERNPFTRNPDEYDLLWPLWAGRWEVDIEKYKHKTAVVIFQPGEGHSDGCKAIGATTPIVEQEFKNHNIPFTSLRFGIDTNLFYPVPALRDNYCCDKLHVGYVGNHANVRHMLKTVISPLRNLKGIHLMLFPHSWMNNGGNFADWDGENLMPYVVGGNKRWTGMPNIYNRMDVLLRIDQDPAYSFPTLEAAACGVPVIATDSGIDHIITKAGGGILIGGNRSFYMNESEKVAKQVREKVEFLRDNRDIVHIMGNRGREEIERNWKWDKFYPSWRRFFQEATA